jgi:uncharacterized membrane protein YdjX (TVP38/TMEM64 family)
MGEVQHPDGQDPGQRVGGDGVGGDVGRQDAGRQGRSPASALLDYVTNMDARAVRAVAVTLALFAVVALMLLLGRTAFGDDVQRFVQNWLGGAERAHWGLPAAIAVFTLTAFVGAPQFVLIAACVVAFGPERGFWYAWAATIVSGGVTFLAGRLAGAQTLKRYGGMAGDRFTRFMGRNAFLASAVIRVVPSAPFVVVNMAMGASRMGFLPYLAGLALGVAPKTAIVAFAGDGLMDALEGNLGAAAVMGALAIAAWFALVISVRKFVRKDGA